MDPKDDIKIIIKIDRLKFSIIVNKDWTLEKCLKLSVKITLLTTLRETKKPYIYPDSEFYLKTQKLNMKDKLRKYAPIGEKENVITIKRAEEDEGERIDIKFIIRYYDENYTTLLNEKEYTINIDSTWTLRELKNI